MSSIPDDRPGVAPVATADVPGIPAEMDGVGILENEGTAALSNLNIDAVFFRRLVPDEWFEKTDMLSTHTRGNFT